MRTDGGLMIREPAPVHAHSPLPAVIACPAGDEGPNRTAIVDALGQYSWESFLTAAGACALALRESGPAGRVAIDCGRSFAYAAGFAGAVAANWTAVPVDWSHGPGPRDDETDIAAVITDRDDPRIPAGAQRGNPALLRWPDLMTRSAGTSAPGQLPLLGGYSMPTSGTTGAMKRVNISGAGLRSAISRFTAHAGLTAADRYLHVAAGTFSSSVRQLFAPLAAGAAVVVAEDHTRQDPAALIELMRGERVTVLDGTPSLLRNLTFAAANGLVPDPFVGTLRQVICASEPLHGDDVERFRRAFGFTGSFQYFYGLTETAGLVGRAAGSGRTAPQAVPAVRELPAVREAFDTAMRALPECDIRVVDDRLDEVADGDLGEVAVLTGTQDVYYEDSPRATALLAMPCPWRAGARMIMTGDLAVRTGGGFRIVGRRDDVVKVRGQRVSLADLATAARAAPGVADAAAVLVEGEFGSDIALFVEAAPGTETVRRIRKHLRGSVRVAAYPRYVTALPELPRTRSGKPELAALRVLAGSAGRQAPPGAV